MDHVSFTEAEPPIHDEDIVRAERILGCTLPEDYRRFLLKENGGRPSLEAFNIQWNDNPVGEGWGASLIHFFLSIHDGKHSNFINYNTSEGVTSCYMTFLFSRQKNLPLDVRLARAFLFLH